MKIKKKHNFNINWRTFLFGAIWGFVIFIACLFLFKIVVRRPIETQGVQTLPVVIDTSKRLEVLKKDEIKKTELTTKVLAPITPVKFDGEIIKVGFMGDFSGGMRDIDNPWLEGMQIRIDEASENKELKNKMIKIEPFDHKGEAQVAVSGIKKLADDGIKILLSSSGSGQLMAIVNTLEQKDFLVLFPATMFDPLKELNFKTFVFAFPSLDEEASVILNYGLNNLFVRKFAIFYEDSYMGKSYLKDVQKVIDKKGLKKDIDYIVSSYPPNTTETKHAADIINKFSPDSVFLFSTPVATASFLNQVNIANIRYFLGTSFVEGDVFYNFAKAKGLNVFISRGVPNFVKTQLYSDFLNAIKKRKIVENTPLFAGYLVASLFMEIVKKMDGLVTKDSILKQIKQDKQYNVKGMNVYLDPSIEINLNENFHVIDLNEKIFDLNGVLVGSSGKV